MWKAVQEGSLHTLKSIPTQYRETTRWLDIRGEHVLCSSPVCSPGLSLTGSEFSVPFVSLVFIYCCAVNTEVVPSVT